MFGLLRGSDQMLLLDDYLAKLKSVAEISAAKADDSSWSDEDVDIGNVMRLGPNKTSADGPARKGS